MNPRCDGCSDQESQFGLSAFQDGSTQFLCGGCLAGFGLAFARETLPAEVIAETLGPIFVGPGKPPPKRGGRRPEEPPEPAAAAEPEPEPAATEAVEGDEAAASDG